MCLKQVFSWKCGCVTEQYVHSANHKKSDGDICPGKVTVVHITMPKRHSHLRYPNAKPVIGKEPEMVTCGGLMEKDPGVGAAWGELDTPADGFGGAPSGNGGGGWGDAEGSGDTQPEDPGW